ncbi:four helix bundle protein [Geminocystis herdmanii]
MANYKDQFIWQKAKNLAVIIYRLTNNYPKKELYGLVSQINHC